MNTSNEAHIHEIEELAELLPYYARMIALQMAYLQVVACKEVGGSPDQEILSGIFRIAVAKVLREHFSLSSEEAESEEEFIDFYVRHGIVTNKLAVVLFRLFVFSGTGNNSELDSWIERGIAAISKQ